MRMWVIFHPFWYIIYNVTFLDLYLYLPSYLLILICRASILSLYISKCNEIALECVQDLYCWQWMRAISNDFQRNIFFLWNVVLDFDIHSIIPSSIYTHNIPFSTKVWAYTMSKIKGGEFVKMEKIKMKKMLLIKVYNLLGFQKKFTFYVLKIRHIKQ